MGIFHDAYLFQPENFAKAVMPYVDALKKSEKGYSLIRNAAISLYDSNSQVRLLTEQYGGWDKNVIVSQVSLYYSQDPKDIAFWFVFFLYSHCLGKPHALGLGNNWRFFAHTLRTLGWNEVDIRILTEGNKFVDLAPQPLSQNGENSNGVMGMEYWKHINPFSQNGQAGWISFQEVQKLFEKVKDDKERLNDIVKITQGDHQLLQRAFHAAFEMLMAAEKSYCGLCIIISG